MGGVPKSCVKTLCLADGTNFVLRSDPPAPWGCLSGEGGDEVVPAPTPPRQTIWMELFHHFIAALGGGAVTPLPTSALPKLTPRPPRGSGGGEGPPSHPPAPWAAAAASRESRGPEAGLGDARGWRGEGCGAGVWVSGGVCSPSRATSGPRLECRSEHG